MMDDIYLITTGGVALVVAIVLLKYLNQSRSIAGVGCRGSYHGLERRTRARSTGALFRRPDGRWMFR